MPNVFSKYVIKNGVVLSFNKIMPNGLVEFQSPLGVLYTTQEDWDNQYSIPDQVVWDISNGIIYNLISCEIGTEKTSYILYSDQNNNEGSMLLSDWLYLPSVDKD